MALALALAGCGSSGTNPPTAVPVAFKSSAIVGQRIPALYTCDGKNITPPMEWGSVPAGTKELVLMVVGLTPSASTNSYSISVEWAIDGVDPALHRLAAGQLPVGAHVGHTSNGTRRYSICPKRGVSKDYQFQLYAVSSLVKIPTDFADLEVLAALSKPHTQVSATAQGAFVAIYERR